MKVIYRTVEDSPEQSTELQYQIILDSQEFYKTHELVRDLVKQNLPPYQAELVQNLLIRFTPKVLDAESGRVDL